MKYIALLLLFAAPAFADVYVYDSNGQAIGQKPTLVADDIVRRCYQYTGPEITPGTHTGCAAYEHARASTIASRERHMHVGHALSLGRYQRRP